MYHIYVYISVEVSIFALAKDIAIFDLSPGHTMAQTWPIRIAVKEEGSI